MVAVPGDTSSGNFITRTNYTFYNVINLGEVSGMIPVSEYLDGFILENVSAEFEQLHAGFAPWALNREGT